MRCEDKKRIFVGSQTKEIMIDRNFDEVLDVTLKHSDWLFTTF
jgi:hypothetical protein